MIILIIIITILSIALGIFFYLDIVPILKERFIKENYLNIGDENRYLELVIEAGVEMLITNKVFMSFNDNDNFYVKLAKIKNGWKVNKYALYNFPKAWLFNGLFDIANSTNNLELIEVIETELINYFDEEGNLKFDFNKVDQCLFGLVLIKLYKKDKKDKYKKALEIIEKKVVKFIKEENDLILYRKEKDVYFVDTLGMVVPFLYLYGETFKRNDLIILADKQLSFYLENGLDNYSNLPFHAIDLSNNIHLGSVNWSRGLGWFLIGLSHGIKYSNKDTNPLYNTYVEKFNSIKQKLEDLKNDKGVWPQFLGDNNDNKIDSSSTVMFLYSYNLVNPTVTKEEIYKLLYSVTNSEGFIDSSSGDTIYINRYAYKKGKSEFTQGILLSLLSLTKENIK